MSSFKEYFKDKKITVMGLGLLGGALNDIHFLHKHGASLLVTDLKTAKELKPSLDKLKKYKDITYVLGGHRMEDFKDCDLILQPGNVPMDSPYLAEAKKNNIPVFVSESLFAKCAEGVILVGITGTRGKSTVTELIYKILKDDDRKVFLGGNVKNVSTLGLLDKVRHGDMVVLELDSWALHGMGDIKISPNVSVFTTFLDDHLAYYGGDRNKYFEDKANIFKYQKKEDVFIIGKQVSPFVEKFIGQGMNKPIIAPEIIKGFPSKLLGTHNEYNVAVAVTVARVLGVKDKIIKKAVKNFKGVPGRLELIRKIRGISFYNDTTATTPDATIAALRALSESRIILIAGGHDKNLDMTKFIETAKGFCKKVILLSGTGTAKIKNLIDAEEFGDLKKAVDAACQVARRGDVVLLSPAFASFGMFKNEFDRGEQFVKIVKKLK